MPAKVFEKPKPQEKSDDDARNGRRLATMASPNSTKLTTEFDDDEDDIHVDLVKVPVTQVENEEAPPPPTKSEAGSEDAVKRTSITDLAQKRKSRAAAKPGVNDIAKVFLGASLMQCGQPKDGLVGVWRKLDMADEDLSPVTAVSFGLMHDSSELALAAGCRDGTIRVWELRRTQIERGGNAVAGDSGDGIDPDLHLDILMPQGSEVSALHFSKCKQRLISLGKQQNTVQFWSLKDGQLLKELADACAVSCVLPVLLGQASNADPAVVMGSTDCTLRLVQDTNWQQKLKLNTVPQSLTATPSGSHVLAGTAGGAIWSFRISADGMVCSGRSEVGRMSIAYLSVFCKEGSPSLVTCIGVPSGGNASECTICILQGNDALTNLTVLQRVPHPYERACPQCCLVAAPSSPPATASTENADAASLSAASCLVTGGPGSRLRVMSLETFLLQDFDATSEGAVGAVAVTAEATMLVSGDESGHLRLWRRGCN